MAFRVFRQRSFLFSDMPPQARSATISQHFFRHIPVSHTASASVVRFPTIAAVSVVSS